MQELARIARLLKGKKVKKNVGLLILTSRAARTLATEMGIVQMIESSGGKVVADTCWSFIPLEGTMMTYSVKMAWVSMNKFTEVGIGNMNRCIEVATGAQRLGDQSYGRNCDKMCSRIAGHLSRRSPCDEATNMPL